MELRAPFIFGKVAGTFGQAIQRTDVEPPRSERLPLRLADYILANTETISQEWETFAGTALPAAARMEPLALRDHIADILKAVVADMNQAQSAQAQSEKSRGLGDDTTGAMGAAANAHALGRHADRFSLVQLLAEFRALRASVVRLWSDSEPAVDLSDVVDIIRFEEAIDQLVAQSVQRYTERVSDSKDLLLGVIGHELRDPLAMVAMSSELLVKQLSSQPGFVTIVTGQKRAVQRMGYIISDLFDITAVRLGTGVAITPMSCDLGTICIECIDEVQAIHPGSSIGWEKSGDCRGEWDESRLRQVVLNLLSNALKHGNGQPVQVSTRGDSETVALAVTNHGPVIHEEDRDRIFDPLVRGIGKRPDARSLGLGLYVSRAIVEAHGGTIDFTSSVKEGTTFTVRVPRIRAPSNDSSQ